MSFLPLSVRPPSPLVAQAADTDSAPGYSPPSSPGVAPGSHHALADLPSRMADGGDALFAAPAPVAAATPPLPPLTERTARLLVVMLEDLSRVLTGTMGLLPQPVDPGEDGEDGGAYDDFLEKSAALAYILDRPLLQDLTPEERLMVLADAVDTDPVALFDMPRGMFEVLLWEITRRISNVVREECARARAPEEQAEAVIAHLEAHARDCIGRLEAMGPPA